MRDRSLETGLRPIKDLSLVIVGNGYVDAADVVTLVNHIARKRIRH